MREETELWVTGLERPFWRLKLENWPIVRVGVMDKKGGEIGTIWTTILNNFLAWKYENLRIFYSDICILSQISLKRILLDVFNADIDVLLTIGASQCSQANLDKH